MEKVRIKNAKGRVKIIGALVCISGALLFTFWKGHLLKGFVDRPLIIVHRSDHEPVHYKDDWIKGSVIILTSNVAFSAWLILQATVYEVYPARLTTNTLICFFAVVQSSVLALIFERNTELLYLASRTTCKPFCISKRGPVFASMFCPLMVIVTGLFSAFFFAERLHVGSLIGASIIILGLYTVLWGKSKDSDEDDKADCRMQMCVQKTSVQFSSPSDESHPV